MQGSWFPTFVQQASCPLRSALRPQERLRPDPQDSAAGRWSGICGVNDMINKVLVPLDGSRASELAIGPAIKLLRRTEGNLVLLHAVTPSEYFSVTAREYVQQERRRSAAYLQQLSERIGANGIGIRERIVTGEASREIVAEARRSQADLIAMSSHGRSGIREWAFGSVAERVLRTTNVPVLVFRKNGSVPFSIRRIMIALDGSEEALAVVGPAADLAAAFEARIELVHAGKTLPPALPMAEKMLKQHGVGYDTRLLRGDPAGAILDHLEEKKADLLALTTTGKTRRDQMFFGSVAEELLKKCGRPILVVHTGRTV